MMKTMCSSSCFQIVMLIVFLFGCASDVHTAESPDDTLINACVSRYKDYKSSFEKSRSIEVPYIIQSSFDAETAFQELLDSRLPDFEIVDDASVLQTESGYFYTWASGARGVCVLIAPKGSSEVLWMPFGPA